jgi:hypothetical protein
VHHCFPLRIAKRPKKKYLGRRPIVANPEEPRAEYASGVEDDRVGGGNHLLEIAEHLVGDLSARAIDDHEPAVTASLVWMLGDSVGGEIEIVMRCAGAVASHEDPLWGAEVSFLHRIWSK